MSTTNFFFFFVLNNREKIDFQVHAAMQPVINGSVHEETPLLSQQPQPQLLTQPQQTVPSQQYIEPVAQEQFAQEPEVVTEQQQQQQQTVEEENRGQTEDSQEQQAAETFQQAAIEPETDHNVTVNVSSDRPKSYARTVRSSAMGPTSNQVLKSSMSPVSKITKS